MSESEKIVASLDTLLERSLRSKKATGTRMLALKCITELGAGWHKCGEVMRKMSEHLPGERLKADYIFELAVKYPALVETKIPQQRSLKDARVKVRDDAYPIVKGLIDQYVAKLKGDR